MDQSHGDGRAWILGGTGGGGQPDAWIRPWYHGSRRGCRAACHRAGRGDRIQQQGRIAGSGWPNARYWFGTMMPFGVEQKAQAAAAAEQAGDEREAAMKRLAVEL
jgi:hypothetical protein